MPEFILPKPTKTATHFDEEDQLTYTADYFKLSALEELQLYYVAGVDAPSTQCRIVSRTHIHNLPPAVEVAMREEGWLDLHSATASAAAHWLAVQIFKVHPIRQHLSDEILLRTEKVKFGGREAGAEEYTYLEVDIYAPSNVSMRDAANLLEWGATPTGLKYELATVHGLVKSEFKSQVINDYP